jgi:putative phage-type endonuclease
MKKCLYHFNVEQRTDAWFKLRELHLTASNASTIISSGKGLETYCRQLVLEKMLPSNREVYLSVDMERGILLEPEAREEYEKQTKQNVNLVTFVEMGKYIGCSPDGLIDKDGGLELKCPNDKTYMNYLLDNEIPKDYYNQCQMGLYITGRQWWDLALYNPNFKKKMIIHRILPDKEVFEKLQKGLTLGTLIIKNLIKRLK